MSDRSILLHLSEEGQDPPRVQLAGSEIAAESTERYQIVGEIARGGVGVIYKGRDSDLGRDVAMKLLRDDHLDRPELIQRLVEEAQVGGQLQHPGIVPVYELGMKSGNRPYFAMKLVKGRTLTELLGERDGSTVNRRALVAHFAQVCQTMAYAHSRGVVHRDLKPSNIMVGSFGEVQVVDWGFAKVLGRGGIADERRAKRDVTVIATVRTAIEGSASVAGSVMGTPAYMPPEQALGQVDDLTERADVFALGAILCEILTGAPAYAGGTEDVFTQAAHARLDDAHARLDRCGADPALIALGRACLSALPKDRPRSAHEVADVVSTHLAEAESRAHNARLRAAEAEAQSEERRRARKQTIGVAAAVLTVVLLGGAAWFTIQRTGAQRERRRIGAFDAAILEATRLDAAADWSGAKSAAEQAFGLTTDDAARRVEAEAVSAQVQTHARAADIAAEKAAGEAALLAQLDDIAARRADDFGGKRTEAAYAAALPDFAALRDFDRKEDLAQHFDTWAVLRRSRSSEGGLQRPEEGDWRSLIEMARTLDSDPWRNRVRDAGAGNDTALLRELAAEPDTVRRSARSLHHLAINLGNSDPEAAIDLLRRAYELHPGDFWINYFLAYYLTGQGRRREPLPYGGIAHALAALAARPASSGARNVLARLLADQGDLDGAILELREAIRIEPSHAQSHINLGVMLMRKGDLDEAAAAIREAIRIEPGFVEAHVKLGSVLLRKGDADGGIAQLREAIRIEPGHPAGHRRLGLALMNSGDNEGALGALHEAIRLDAAGALPDTRIMLGQTLEKTGDLDGAIAAYREAVRLGPGNPWCHWALGTALGKKSDLHGAVEACGQAAALAPGEPLFRRALGDAERMAAMHARLPAVLRGDDRPATAAEWRALATICMNRKDYVEAARLWRQAFEESPALAAGLRNNRYDAACAAALAGTAEWRSQADAWLRADLALRAEQVKGKPFPDASPAAKALRHWLKDPDLASIRDEAALAKLPEAEREALRALWRDVRALVEEASQ